MFIIEFIRNYYMIMIVLLFTFIGYPLNKRRMRKIDKIQKSELQIRAESCMNSLEKTLKITYLKELKELNIFNIDENICTINLENNLSNTKMIKIVAGISETFGLEIMSITTMSDYLMIYFKQSYVGTIILKSNSITITCENFDFLVQIRNTIKEI